MFSLTMNYLTMFLVSRYVTLRYEVYLFSYYHNVKWKPFRNFVYCKFVVLMLMLTI